VLLLLAAGWTRPALDDSGVWISKTLEDSERSEQNRADDVTDKRKIPHCIAAAIFAH
jgi:hypothetical protein